MDILLTAGITLEAVGIGLVAASDWWPETLEKSAELARRAVETKTRIARRIQRRREHHSGSVRIGTAVEIDTAGSITPSKSCPPALTVDERIRRLELGAVEASARHDLLEKKVEATKTRVHRQLNVVRLDLTQLIEKRLQESEGEYRSARQAGLLALLFGLVFTALSAAF